MPKIAAIRHPSERDFAKAYFDHEEWEYQPEMVVCGVMYRPDFYDKKRGVYIEVIGTHQAFYANSAKYAHILRNSVGLTLEFWDRTGQRVGVKLCKNGSSVSLREQTKGEDTRFTRLADRYGNHSLAARALGITPEHYRRVRRTSHLTGPLKVLVERLAEESQPETANG